MVRTETEWAELVHGRLERNAEMPANGALRNLSGAATLEEAEAHHLSFLAQPAYAAKAVRSKAGLILVPETLELRNEFGATLLRVADPYAAWAQVLSVLWTDSPFADARPCAATPEGAWIHPSAEVHPSARIHPGVWIGAGATVGADCILYSGAKIYPNTRMGSGCIVHANAVLGSDGFGYTPPQPAAGRAGFGKIPHIGWVELESDVEIGAGTCIDRGVVGATRIGKGTKLDNLCHLAHNVTVGAHCVFAAQVGVAGSTKIGNYVRIGGQAGLNGHIVIGDQCEIAAQSGVTKSLAPKSVVWGTPAMPLPQFLRAWAKLKSLSR